MSQSTVIKRTKTNRKASPSALPYIPQFLQAFLARRFVDIVAFIVFVTGAFLILALLSYNHADPSMNSAVGIADTPEISSAYISNWMGASGAYIADLFLQTIGLGSLLLGVTLCIWGVRIFRRTHLSSLPLRCIAFLAMPIFGALALAQIPSGGWLVHPYLGSSAGTLMLNGIHDSARVLPYGIGTFFHPALICFLAAIICLSCFSFASGFTREAHKVLASRILALITLLFSIIIRSVQHFANWLRHYNEPEFQAPREKSFALPSFNARALFGKGNEDSDLDDLLDAPSKPRAKASPRLAAPKGDINIPAVESRKQNPSIPVVAKISGAAQSAEKTQTSSQASQKRFPLNEQGNWELPALDLLNPTPVVDPSLHLDEEALRKNAELLQNVLNDFKIEGDIVSIHPGPVVTLYELEPAPGTKSSRIISLSDDIARSMSAISVRCAVVPGRNVIGIELPNKKRQFVYMRELLESREFVKGTAALPLILGKDIGGQPILADLAKMPHLLVAGTTGSGKSVAVNTMILSLLYRLPPEKCRFIMIDPKMLELSVYDNIPHLLSPVVTEPGKAVVALKWTVAEMENRYRAMSKLGVRNIEGYNERLREARKKGETIMQKVQTGFDVETGAATYEDRPMDLTELPFIVVVVDEFADLMLVAGKDVENAIQRLAQMARAAGIHLIMATQRPSVDVITGVIKANFPTRISFQVTSKIDSRTILGDGGAEQLLGMGDMLYMAPGGRITRVHGPFVSDDEVETVVKFLKSQGEPDYISDVTSGDDFGDSEIMNAIFEGRGGNGGDSVDELYDQAVAIVAREGKVSTSFIQRHLQIGYNRAARIVEEMERQGIISPANATGKRNILVQDWSEV